MRNNFALDLTKRCQAEFEKSFKKYDTCTPKLISNLSYATDAIVKCYQGDHSLCHKQSNVCWVAGTSWIDRSTHVQLIQPFPSVFCTDFFSKITCKP